ncbi:MAG: mercury resistance protein [Betaproteobacteria bacterium]|nr:mercury resistance protein [Betaproteobacteria bacterium]MBI2961873.1 mercury resistance protein [Betaproteobacteria bacterium]
MTFIMGMMAFLTCPCHLPILLLLLSGTAAGSALAANTGTALWVLLAVFALSAYATWRLLDGGARAREADPGDSRAHRE